MAVRGAARYATSEAATVYRRADAYFGIWQLVNPADGR
jgi:hypothetical protein